MKNEKSAGVQVFFNIRLFVKQYNAKLTPDVLLRYGEKPWHTDLRWRSVAAIFCGINILCGNITRRSVQTQVVLSQRFNSLYGCIVQRKGAKQGAKRHVLHGFSRQFIRFEPLKPPWMTALGIVKDRHSGCQRLWMAHRKAVIGETGGRERRRGKLFCDKPLTFFSWHIVIIPCHCHCFLTQPAVCADRAQRRVTKHWKHPAQSNFLNS